MIGAEESTEIIALTMHYPIVHEYSMNVTTQLTWEGGAITAACKPSSYLRT